METNKGKPKRRITLFIFSLLLMLPSLVGCSSSNPEFINEYNSKLDEVNTLIEQHDQLINKINSNINNPVIQRQKMEEYISWVGMNREKISTFKLYIETNYQQIRATGVNPDYVRDNVIQYLNVMQENEMSFRQAIATQDIMGNY